MKISIIVPIYNIEKYLKKCIESIIEQTYKDIEIILVDDESQDESGTISDEYAKKDERIKVYHKKNGGLSDARNFGIEKATGDFIMFVDGDDYIKPAMCEILLRALIENDADVSICNYQYVSENPQDVKRWEKQNLSQPIRNEVITGRSVIEEKFCEEKHWYWVVAWNKLYKKDIFKDIRFPYGKIHEDEFIIFDVFNSVNKLACVEADLYCYVQREGSIMNQEYNIKRLDAAEAFIKRASKMIDAEYSKQIIFKTLCEFISSILLVFRYEKYENDLYKKRFRTLLKQYRKIGFIKLLRNSDSIKGKIFLFINYIHPYLYWRMKKKD